MLKHSCIVFALLMFLVPALHTIMEFISVKLLTYFCFSAASRVSGGR